MTVGHDKQTYEHWRIRGIGADRRHRPNHAPKNKPSKAERKLLMMVLTSPMYRDLSPKQVVPLLGEAGRYIASESAAYRVLRAAGRCVAPQCWRRCGLWESRHILQPATRKR